MKRISRLFLMKPTVIHEILKETFHFKASIDFDVTLNGQKMACLCSSDSNIRPIIPNTLSTVHYIWSFLPYRRHQPRNLSPVRNRSGNCNIVAVVVILKVVITLSLLGGKSSFFRSKTSLPPFLLKNYEHCSIKFIRNDMDNNQKIRR